MSKKGGGGREGEGKGEGEEGGGGEGGGNYQALCCPNRTCVSFLYNSVMAFARKYLLCHFRGILLLMLWENYDEN